MSRYVSVVLRIQFKNVWQLLFTKYNSSDKYYFITKDFEIKSYHENIGLVNILICF